MAIKKGDFVEIEYSGRLKEDNSIFDTTDDKTAKDNGIYNEKTKYGAVVICIGQNQILAGLDNELEGKEAGKSCTIELAPEHAFGRKNPKLIQLVPTNKFKQNNIEPRPGLQVNIDGALAMVKSVSGGRTLVDFNHPLAGRGIVYDVKINRIVADDREKLASFLKLSRLKPKEIVLENKTAKITIDKEMTEDVKGLLTKKIGELIRTIEKVEFIIRKQEKK